jgi:hypothetical protein
MCLFLYFSLREVDVARVKELRRRLIARGLTGKTVTNVIGLLHKVMSDATEEGFGSTSASGFPRSSGLASARAASTTSATASSRSPSRRARTPAG